MHSFGAEERIEALEEAISDWYDNGAQCADGPFDSFVTEMFEVCGFGSEGHSLMSLFEPITFAPVIFPSHIAQLLRTEDVFLLTMGSKEGQWHVTEMSPPYEMCGFDHDVEN